MSISCIGNTQKGHVDIANLNSMSSQTDHSSEQKLSKSVRDSILHSPPFVVDTIVGRFHISYTVSDNEDIVAAKHYLTADRSIVLSVEREGKPLVSNKEIRKHDFDSIIPPNIITKAQLWNGFIWEHNDENVVVFINICIPDTDICHPILLSINSMGQLSANDEISEDKY